MPRYKAVLLYKDIPINQWPVDASGEFIFKIIDLPLSNQVPDKRPWRLWTAEQANQYSEELNNDFDRFDQAFDKVTDQRKKILEFEKLERFGVGVYKKFKVKAKDIGPKASDLLKIQKDFADFKLFLEAGFLGSSLIELSGINTQDFEEDDIVEIGNEIRSFLGLDPVVTQDELADGVE